MGLHALLYLALGLIGVGAVFVLFYATSDEGIVVSEEQSDERFDL